MTNLFVIFCAQYLIWGLFFIPLIYLQLTNNRRLAIQTLASVGLAWIIGEFIKSWFYFPRPFINSTIPLLIPSLSDGSFPSNHTLTSFTLAFTIFYSHRRLGLVCLLVSTLIGTSRVLAGVHYSTDVLGGITIAFVLSLFLRRVFRH
jgi:undecaprenyl-diphosphatase